MVKHDLKSLSLDELKELFIEMGEKSYRGEQVFRWIHQKMIESIKDISVLSKELRDKLNNKYRLINLKIVKRLESKIDDTKKYLFLLDDGNVIESVIMKYKHGYSICVSTQVGCRMGCKFCASTKDGLVRNLTAGEIADQIYKIQKDLGITVSNIVLMGSGEPFDNYDNVIKFLNIIHDKLGQNIGYRHITISTCGIVSKIYKLADEGIPVNLSISLHSPFQEERYRIMPISKKFTLEQVIDACKYYINKTKRRVTFEYTLIEGVNDRKDDARELSKLLKGLLCHINLIPLNPIKENNLSSPDVTFVEKFRRELEKYGISVTVRRELGSDINAACGQLRRDYIGSKEN